MTENCRLSYYHTRVIDRVKCNKTEQNSIQYDENGMDKIEWNKIKQVNKCK